MFAKTGIWLLVAALLLPALSCTRVPGWPSPEQAPLQAVRLPALESIPAEWGRLVTVSAKPDTPGWYLLWFEDDSHTVRMVTFNFRTSRLDPSVTVFPRS